MPVVAHRVSVSAKKEWEVSAVVEEGHARDVGEPD